jgi:DNA-directed RNA polymerase subunit RPC12/RpoP
MSNANATYIDAAVRNLYSRPARKEHVNAGHIAHCALCGASSADTHLLGGRSGYVCWSCLSPVFAAVAKTYSQPRGTNEAEHPLNASYRCFICDKRISAARLIAYRHPFCFCGDCLQTAFDICTTDSLEPLSIVKF